MTYSEYLNRISDASSYKSAADHLAEYGFPPDCEFTADGLVKVFEIIHAVSREDFTKLIDLSGGNLSAMSRYYNIPLRTAQEWKSGARKPPEYIIQMIGFVMISECEREEE